MEGKSLTILVIPALLMLILLAGCAPSHTDEMEEQEVEEGHIRGRSIFIRKDGRWVFFGGCIQGL